jgi:hypothetical protein
VATRPPPQIEAPYPEPHFLRTQTPILPEEAVYKGTTPQEVAREVVIRHHAIGDPMFAVTPTVQAASWVCPASASRFGATADSVAYQSPWDVAVLFEGSFTPNWPGTYIGTPSTQRYLLMIVDLYSGSPWSQQTANRPEELRAYFDEE